MSTFVHAGCNANHFLESVLASDSTDPIDFPEILSRYGVQHVMEETSEQELIDLNNDLPTDTHLVSFRNLDGSTSSDAVRAFTMSDIFDAYADSGVTVLEIKSGYGAIKPKLFNTGTKK